MSCSRCTATGSCVPVWPGPLSNPCTTDELRERQAWPVRAGRSHSTEISSLGPRSESDSVRSRRFPQDVPYPEDDSIAERAGGFQSQPARMQEEERNEEQQRVSEQPREGQGGRWGAVRKHITWQEAINSQYYDSQWARWQSAFDPQRRHLAPLPRQLDSAALTAGAHHPEGPEQSISAQWP